MKKKTTVALKPRVLYVFKPKNAKTNSQAAYSNTSVGTVISTASSCCFG